MEKIEFIPLLKQSKSRLQILAKKCEKAPGKQVQSKALLSELEAFATSWFEQIEPILRSTYRFSEESLLPLREAFGSILEVCGGKPSKQVVAAIFEPLLESFHRTLIVPVQKQNEISSKFPKLADVLGHAVGLELDYLSEAVKCAQLGKLRASIILGWCAAVNRLHLYVQQEGFLKFNQASIQMHAIQTGRYKRFNKRFDIQNLADLRMSVFDNDLLWVLEFLGAIDGNQHEKLEICFTMRNTCAHPGEASVSPENVLSFFSDLDSLVFENTRFVLRSTPA